LKSNKSVYFDSLGYTSFIFRKFDR